MSGMVSNSKQSQLHIESNDETSLDSDSPNRKAEPKQRSDEETRSKPTMEELLAKYPKPKELFQDEEDRNNEERANLFDVLSFRYLEPLIRLGYRRPLVPDDLPKLATNQNCLLLAPRLEQQWNVEIESGRKSGKKPSLLKAIVYQTRRSIITCLALQTLMRVAQICEPLALQRVLLWLAPENAPSGQSGDTRGPLKEGVLWGLALVLMTLLQAIVQNVYFHIGYRLLVQIRNACCSLIYAKALRLGSFESSSLTQDGSKDSQDNKKSKRSSPDKSKSGPQSGRLSIGQVVNLMSVDGEKVGNMFFFGYSTFMVPFQLAVIIYLLYDTVGVSVFAGLGILLILLPSIAISIMIAAKVTRERLILVDNRVKLTNEILQGIRVVKAYAWELFFQEKLGEARDQEIDLLFKWNILSGFNLFGFTLMTSLFAVCTFSVYAALGNTLRAATVFKALSFMNALQMPLIQLPNSFNHIINGFVSIERLEKFLLQPELPLVKHVDCRAPLLLHRKRYLANVRRAEVRRTEPPRLDVIATSEVRDLRLEDIDQSVLGVTAAGRIPKSWVKIIHKRYEKFIEDSQIKDLSEVELPRLQVSTHLTEHGDLISPSEISYDPETGEPEDEQIIELQESYGAHPDLPESGWRSMDPDILSEARVTVSMPFNTVLAPSRRDFLVEIENATFSWHAFNSVPLWEDFEVKVKAQKLTAKQRYNELGEEVEMASVVASHPISSVSQFRPTIKNVNFVLPKGKLVAVVGPVGSGKSTLISSILGELSPVTGSLSLARNLRMSYVAQTPFVQTMTLRDNILFVDSVPFGGPGLDEPGTSEPEHLSARAARNLRIQRYQKAINAAALGQDIDSFEAGDETEIGDRGINLSGGQKQRVAIARALYHDADLYIFDDPLSALDAHVAEHVFDKAICGVLSDKTRLLVTNQLHFLPRCDYIYLLGVSQEDSSLIQVEELKAVSESSLSAEASPSEQVSPTKYEVGVGSILASGSFNELMVSCKEFKALMEHYENDVRSSLKDSSSSVNVETKIPEKLNDEDLCSPQVFETKSDLELKDIELGTDYDEETSTGGPVDISIEHDIAQTNADMRAVAAVQRDHDADKKDQYNLKFATDRAVIGGGRTKKGQQITEEETAVGGVPLQVFWFHFLTMGGAKVAIPMMLSAVLAQGALITLNMLLGYWVDKKSNSVNDSYRGWYLMTLGIAVGLLFVRGIFFAFGAVRSASYYHSRLAVRITRATPEFFDVTPVGRIISRFSKDLDIVDTTVPHLFLQATTFTLGFLGSLVTCAIILPWFTIAVVVIITLFYFLHRYYSSSALQMQRIESNSRSPVFQNFGETLKGLSTIRAFGVSTEFQMRSSQLLNENSSALYNVRMIYRWGALRVNYLQCTMTFIVVALVVFAPRGLSAGAAGVALSYIIAVGGTIGFLVTQLVELSGRINSVERLRYYLATIPQEPPLAINPEEEIAAGLSPTIAYAKQSSSSEVWPSHGKIKYDNIHMRYREDLPPVLKGLSFVINAGHKVGIVGRTGSGKSSLMMLLLRMYNPEKGKILIDDVDISGVGLHRLRSRIGIVPQEPVMFSGTLRSNLDPFQNYGDNTVLDALKAVGLENLTLSLPNGLESEVMEYGSNFSQGQRQLICVARVLLKKPSLLLLDEATSSVDSNTDSLLREVLSTRFGNATQVTIAHRLNTVADADRVLVLDQGKLVEEGAPKELIDAGEQSGKGIFASMYKAYLNRGAE